MIQQQSKNFEVINLEMDLNTMESNLSPQKESKISNEKEAFKSSLSTI